MSLNRIVNDFKTICKNSHVMLIEAKDYSKKTYVSTDVLSVELVKQYIDEWGAVSLNSINTESLARNMEKYYTEAKAKGNGRYNDAPEKVDPDKIDEILEEFFFPKAVSSQDVLYKPYIMIDIDLWMQKDELYERELISMEIRDMEERDYKKHIYDLPGESKKEMIRELIDLDTLVEKTEPALIVFAGNGLHIHYFSPFKMDNKLYRHIYSGLKDQLLELFPYLKFDEAADSINQNIRLPESYNFKGKNPVRCETLYECPEPAVTALIERRKKNYRPSKAPERTEVLDGRIQQYLNKTVPHYQGLRNIQRDYRFFKFMKTWCSFENIMEFFDIPVRNRTDHEEYFLVSSPLRKDDNPSFMVNPRRMICTDLGRGGEEIDYGQLVQRLLENSRTEFSIPGRVTRYMAEFTCGLIAFIAHAETTGRACFPMLSNKAEAKRKKQEAQMPDPAVELPDDMESDPEDAGPDQAKVDIKAAKTKGASWYKTLQTQYLTLLEYKDKYRDLAYKDILRYLVGKLPTVYYFYENKANKGSEAQFLQGVVELAVIHYFNEYNVGVRLKGDRIDIYTAHKNEPHKPWVSSWPYGLHTDGQWKESAKSSIQLFLAQHGFLAGGKLPPGNSALHKTVFDTLCSLSQLPSKIYEYVIREEHQSDATLQNAFSSYFRENCLLEISAKDLSVHWLNDERYIQFNNCFIMYDADDTDKIGTRIPYTKQSRIALIKKSLVDLRIRLKLPETTDNFKTPLWDHFCKTSEYDSNLFLKVISYFYGSMLYPPDAETRAVFVWGKSGDNGKSVLAEITAALLANPNYVTYKDIAEISKDGTPAKRPRAEMLEALVNISPDNTKEKLGLNFKKLISGEPLPAAKLYMNEIDVRLRAHFLANANSLPGTHGDLYPMKKRMLILRLHRAVPMDKRIPRLGEKIGEQEVAGLWQWVLEQARNYRANGGIRAFFTQEEIDILERPMVDKDDLYCFIEEFASYEPALAHIRLTESAFKQIYNDYRGYIDKNAVRSDSVFEDAELYFQKIFQGKMPEKILSKGFKYRTSKGKGLPIRIYIPENTVNNPIALDSESMRPR